MKESTAAAVLILGICIVALWGLTELMDGNDYDLGPNVDDYDFQLIETDGLHTEFYLVFDASRSGTVSAYLEGVGIMINGQSSLSYHAGYNSIRCEIHGVGLSGVTLLNALELRFI